MTYVFQKGVFSDIDDPYADKVWETRNVCIKDDKGNTLFEKNRVVVPSFWSENASNVLASKYLGKFPISGDGEGERDLRQAVNRVVDTITDFGISCGYFDRSNSLVFSNALKYLLVRQYGCFNSPVWFNCGLHKYRKNVRGYYWDLDVGSIAHGGSRPQCSACFIQSVQDDLGSIYDLLKQEAMIFKYGSGSGTNFSNLRSKYETLSGGGYSSGLMSFLEVFDRACGSTKSGGVTRRAAKMNIVDIDHPEIFDFIRWKAREEDKASILLNAGYTGGMDGEVYQTISGQNVNNTVRIPDEFMYDLHRTWGTRLRTTGEIHKTVDSHALLYELAKSAWRCGDPGVHFSDNINRYNTCADYGVIRASNPCSEYMFLDDTACNLASLNLVKFIDPRTNRINFDIFREAIGIFLVAQDILVDLSQYPTQEIARMSHMFRPLGLGYTNLGSYLMRCGMAYGSDESCEEVAKITAVMTHEAYKVSKRLGEKLGCFEDYSKESSMEKVLAQYAANVEKYISEDAGFCLDTYFKDLMGSSFRNAQVTLLAPTGTIGILMDCDTTGIEPHYSLVTEKTLVGGGRVKKVSQAVFPALMRSGCTEERACDICNQLEAGELDAEELKSDLFACAVGKNRIGIAEHLKVMQAAQMFLSGGISKTVNLPNDATVGDVLSVFVNAWEMGLKSVTVYRDGCKHVQPLKDITATQKEDIHKEDVVPISNDNSTVPEHKGRRCLPDKRKGFTQKALVAEQKVFLRTGEYTDGTLGEIFVDMHKEGAAFRSLMNCFSMAVSLGLQYGVPLSKFVKLFTFTRFEPQGVVSGHENIKFATSIIDYIFRVLGIEYLGMKELGHVIPSKAGCASMGDAPFCPHCGNLTVRSGTCFYCNNCGNTTGCS